MYYVITIASWTTVVCELVEVSSTGVCGRECIVTRTVPVVESVGLMWRRKWVTQYDSLFIMQGNGGQIIFWHLNNIQGSKRWTAISWAKDQCSKKYKVKIIINNCSSWRKKLTNTLEEWHWSQTGYHSCSEESVRCTVTLP